MTSRLLRPQHFPGCTTSLTAAGLGYKERIGAMHRESACLSLSDTFEGLDAILQKLAERAPTRIVLNPEKPSAKGLGSKLRKAQRREICKEAINVRYGLPSIYERSWNVHPILDRCVEEGQSLVFVAYAHGQAVGYFGLELSIIRDYEGRLVRVRFRGEMIYVIPSFRGQGYGIDLCVAVCDFANDILHASYRAMRPSWTLEAAVSADFESKGGEAVTQELHGTLEYVFDVLREAGRRKSIKFGAVDFDADW